MRGALEVIDREAESRCRSRMPSLPCYSPESSTVRKISILQAMDVLGKVDELDEEATGALVFQNGPEQGGAVLVEGRRICWAVAPGLKRRLIQVLIHQGADRVEPDKLEEVFRRCKEHQKPFGEALVEEGLVGEHGLRSALRQHTAEAIAQLCSHAGTTKFLPHRKKSYNPTFTFSTAEVLCALGALRDAHLSADASNLLRELLPQDTSGVVYSRDLGASPVPLGVWEEEPLTAGTLSDIASWASGALDIGGAVGQGLRMISSSDTHGRSIALWQDGHLMFAALCSNAKSLARVLMGVSRR